MNVHFIAIGGSAMHNLAIALRKKGFVITGSDDEFFEPSKSKLLKYNLMPTKIGWHRENIHQHLDAVILGMHAREDNPELIEAKRLGLKIYSYPEYIYEQSKDKTRVVIGGSHGKTTITSMIMHVLNFLDKKFDYLVGAQIEGFETMVGITKDAPVIILEGDEYLSSPLDKRPKFHLYNPDIALISGIAWDHINVFPTFENYVEQFKIFIDKISENGTLIYSENDEIVKQISEASKNKINKIPYNVHPSIVKDNQTYLITNNEEIPLHIFGGHNMQNISGCKIICNQLGISNDEFYKAIQTYKGAAKRLQIIKQNDSTVIFQDFAHSPSKLKATTKAVKAQFENRYLVACLELHTFSSLNKNFLDEYNGAINDADEAIVYFNPLTLEHKKLEPITVEDVKKAFNRRDLKVYTSSKQLVADLIKYSWENKNLLMMSSGNFDGINFSKFGDKLI